MVEALLFHTIDGRMIMIRIPGTVDLLINPWEAEKLHKQLTDILLDFKVHPDNIQGFELKIRVQHTTGDRGTVTNLTPSTLYVKWDDGGVGEFHMSYLAEHPRFIVPIKNGGK